MTATVHFIKTIQRPSVHTVEELSRFGAATVHEALGRIGAMHHSIKPIARGMKICGPAFTAQCHAGDNLMILKAVKEARRGDVVIADFGRIAESGPFGELIAIECQTKGLAGFLTTGSVRDSAEIIAMNFPVFASSLSIIGTVKESIGRINHPIVVGGVAVRPGDIILGDDDGVVVVPLERAEEAVRKSAEREEKENAVKEKLKAGGSVFDIYGYQKVLDRNGWVEE